MTVGKSWEKEESGLVWLMPAWKTTNSYMSFRILTAAHESVSSNWPPNLKKFPGDMVWGAMRVLRKLQPVRRFSLKEPGDYIEFYFRDMIEGAGRLR